MSGCKAHIHPRIDTHPGSILGKPGFRSLTLTRFAHNPQHILNEVKKFTRHPDYIQQGHMKRFVEIFKRWISIETTNDADQLKDLRKDLVSAMGALDGFFFYKSLTANWHGRGMELKFEGNIFSAGHRGYDARLRMQTKEDPKGITSTRDGRTTIFIDAFGNGVPRTIMDIFETLLHEIAHAIFAQFRTWECESCKSSDPAVLGSYGHGLVWVGLFEHMRDTMRSWDRVLNNFSTDDLVWMHNWKP